MRLEAGQGRADENTSPTRKRGAGIIPSLRVGLVLTPLVQLLAAISSGQGVEPRRHDEHRVSFRYAIVFPLRTSCLRGWHGRVLDSDWSPGDRHSTRLPKLLDVSLRIRFRSMRMSWPCRLAAQWTVPSRGISG